MGAVDVNKSTTKDTASINQCVRHISPPYPAAVENFVYVNCIDLKCINPAQISNKAWSNYPRVASIVLDLKMVVYRKKRVNNTTLL